MKCTVAFFALNFMRWTSIGKMIMTTIKDDQIFRQVYLFFEPFYCEIRRLDFVMHLAYCEFSQSYYTWSLRVPELMFFKLQLL